MIEPLSPRQREVLALIAQGYSNTEVARALVVEQRTVETHISDIYQRLGINARERGSGAARVLAVLWWLGQEKADE